MLQLRPNCECCNVDLPPESTEARICSFECTFCASCAEGVLAGQCPNCGGELVVRPGVPRETGKVSASAERVFKPKGADGMRHSRCEFAHPMRTPIEVLPMTPKLRPVN